jgi:hypothetical protein
MVDVLGAITKLPIFINYRSQHGQKLQLPATKTRSPLRRIGHFKSIRHSKSGAEPGAARAIVLIFNRLCREMRRSRKFLSSAVQICRRPSGRFGWHVFWQIILKNYQKV